MGGRNGSLLCLPGDGADWEPDLVQSLSLLIIIANTISIFQPPTLTDAIRDRDSFQKGRSYEAYILVRFVRDWKGCGKGLGWRGFRSRDYQSIEIQPFINKP